MQWEKSFEIGCEKVDNQHRELVNLVSEFENSLKGRINGEQIAQILRFIVAYTRYHFSAEEEFMKNIGYDELQSHKTIHDELIQDVTNILLRLKRGETLDPNQLLTFLIDWVKAHVLEEDKKIGDFYFRQSKNSFVCPLAKSKENIINKFEKLKQLFLKKLIVIEDYREQKVKILIEGFKDIGKNHLREFYGILQELIANDLLTEKEKKLFSEQAFANSSLKDELTQIADVEAKLFLIRIFIENELATEEEVHEEKCRILDEL